MSTALIILLVVVALILLILLVSYGIKLEDRRQAEARLQAERLAKRRQEEKIKREEEKIKREEEKRMREEEQARRKAESEEAERQEDQKNGVVRLRLSPKVKEFTPLSVPKDKQLKVTVTGTYGYKHWGWHKADALWYCASGDAENNFCHSYRNLLIDDGTVQRPLFEENRELHSYSFIYVGQGRKMSLEILPAREAPRSYQRKAVDSDRAAVSAG
jgi:hypothetical protein